MDLEILDQEAQKKLQPLLQGVTRALNESVLLSPLEPLDDSLSKDHKGSVGGCSNTIANISFGDTPRQTPRDQQAQQIQQPQPCSSNTSSSYGSFCQGHSSSLATESDHHTQGVVQLGQLQNVFLFLMALFALMLLLTQVQLS